MGRYFYCLFSSFLIIADNKDELGATASSHSFAPNVHVNNVVNDASNANGNNLNINLPDKNAVLRLEVELRDKNVRRRPNQQHRNKGYSVDRNKPVAAAVARKPAPLKNLSDTDTDNFFVPMEKVSESSYFPFFDFGNSRKNMNNYHRRALQT